MPPLQLVEEQRIRHRAANRRAILDAAEDLLVESGLDGFSMRRLADRCGCSAPALYHYFRDKPTLVDALLEERLARLVSELRTVAHSDRPVENVKIMCSAFAAFALRHPNHYQLLSMNRDADTPEPASGEEARRLLAGPLEELVRRGSLAANDLETLRQALWSLLHGFILLRTTRPDEDWKDGVLERAIESLVRSWIAAPVTAGEPE